MTLLSSPSHGHLSSLTSLTLICAAIDDSFLPRGVNRTYYFKATRTHTTSKIKAYSGSVHSLSDETVSHASSQSDGTCLWQTRPHTLASDSLSHSGAFTHLEKLRSFSSAHASVISFFCETFIIPFLLVPFFKHPNRNLLLSSKHFIFTSCSKAQLLYRGSCWG